MKYTLLFALFFSALNSFGLATGANDRPEQFLVLGAGESNPGYLIPNFSNYPVFEFPCTLVVDRVRCKEKSVFRIDNEQCAKSVWISSIGDKIDVTCNIKLRKILLAVTNKNARKHVPNSSYDFLPVRLSNAVTVKPSRTPGYLYDVVVDPNVTNSGW